MNPNYKKPFTLLKMNINTQPHIYNPYNHYIPPSTQFSFR